MTPPIVSVNYANAPSYDDLMNALEQIRHATAPMPDDGGHHEAAHDLADAVLKRIEARKHYEATISASLARATGDEPEVTEIVFSASDLGPNAKLTG